MEEIALVFGILSAIMLVCMFAAIREAEKSKRDDNGI